jgi:PPOX class probable F420-dependent enzyme
MPITVKPGPLTDAEKRVFFQRPLIARLGTVDPDGAPYVVPVWFEWDERDGSFWIVIREKARFMPGLLREPRVCLSIAAESPPYTRATVMGRAEIVGRPRESDEWKAIARRMSARYVADVDPGYFDRTVVHPRWLIRIAPTEMTTWRGGGWHRKYTQ